ncbi:FkbM family methyltransferase [Rhizobium tubonense]|uniref:Methyltransferase n=1 Tax=Rhizobium tubonense TaxID=484088 RepID=A0A2W4EVG4_9HYPH|nr:FkbM family methyltransferase [Rhizobium tubonense]PZM14683.1 methyltransferase [Rhizobium tubonense]
MFTRRIWSTKAWSRPIRKIRNRIATRLFDTRYGRELLVDAMGPRVTTMTIDCGDHLMSVSPSDYIGRKVFRKGHFERDHVDRLLSVLRERGLQRKGTVLLELGGNIGTQTIYFALSGAYRRIVTVEPDPRNFRLLFTNLAQNGLEDRVTAVNCAAGDRHGELDFFLNRNNHGKSSALRQGGGDERISVPVRPVPEILAETATDASDIGLIWMDIEGYEPVACRSMRRLMERKVPLYMEFTPAFYGREQSTDFIGYLGGFYRDCMVFSDGDDAIEMKVADLPVEGPQFDVLFMA